MLKLANNRAHLWQWDADQTLVVERADVTEVHFRDLSGDTAMVLDVIEQDGKRVVQIPNILLQQARTIDAYACRMVDGIATLDHVAIEVKARQRPADYVYTETEVKRWETLEERVAALEEAGSGSDGVSPTVEITPIEGGHRVSITDINGVQTADVMDGKDGVDGRDGKDGDPGYTPVKGIDYSDGKDGVDGISPTVAVQDITGGHRVTITDKDGAKTFDVLDGKAGTGGGGGSGVQADWNVNDESDPAYVKNRTHWVERPYEPIVWDGNTEGRDSVDLSMLRVGTVYKVSDHQLTQDDIIKSQIKYTRTNGKDITATVDLYGDASMLHSGIPQGFASVVSISLHSGDSSWPDDFIFVAHVAGDFSSTLGMVIPSVGTYCMRSDHYFPSSIKAEVYHTIDPRYLEGSQTIVDVAEQPEAASRGVLYRLIEGNFYKANVLQSYATCIVVDELPEIGTPVTDSAMSTFTAYYSTKTKQTSGYAPEELASLVGMPAGWYSVSILLELVKGEYFGGVVYDGSEIYGTDTFLIITENIYQLSGDSLKRIGVGVDGEGKGSERFNTVFNKASGDYSHAEGYETTASHDYSHAEGYETTASGYAAHAEGGGTTASARAQHVEGEYNVIDEVSTPTNRGQYAHIVGNGTSDTERSNAHTLDWDGNGWYAGTVECTGIIMTSPNGTRYRLTVSDDGTLTASAM